MRKLPGVALALILGACGAPKPQGAPESAPAPAFKISKTFACPLPAHRGLLSVDADGKAALVIFDGLDGPPHSTSRRQKKQLSPADMSELARIVAESDFKTFPERVESFPPKYEQTDPCDHSLEITADGVTKRVSYRDGDVPKDLADFVGKLNQVIDRVSWEPDVYPWEKR